MKRPRSWIDLALALLVVALVGAALLPDGPAWGGRDWDQFEADLLSARRSLLAGELPLWMPYRVGGHDAWADPQSLWCSPLGLLVLVGGLRWGVCLYFALAAGVLVRGVQRLGRELGLGPGGRNLAAVALALSSPLALYAAGGIPTFVAGLALLPWLTLAALREDWRWAVGGGALLALDLYAGDVNHFLFHAVFLTLLGSGLALAGRRARPLLQVAVLGVAAAAFAGPKLVPTALLARELPRVQDTSQRGALTPRLAALALLDRQAAPRFVARPFAEFVVLTRDGRLANRERPAAPEDVLPGTAVDWINVGHYLGPLVLLLALVGAAGVAGWGEPRRRAQLGALCAAAALLGWLACGSNPALSAWDLLHRLPVFSSTRSPAKLLLYPAFVLALAAGVGLDLLAARLRRAGLSRGGQRALVGLAVGLVLLDVHPPARATFRAAYCEPPRPLRAAPELGFRQLALPPPQGSSHYGVAVRPCVEAELGAVNGYTAVPVEARALALDAPGYRGEAWVVEDGAGRARRWRFTARRIVVTLTPAGARTLGLNSNWAAGWSAVAPAGARCVRRDDGRLGVELPAGAEVVELRYTPPGLGLGLLLLALGAPSLVGWAARSPGAARGPSPRVGQDRRG